MDFSQFAPVIMDAHPDASVSSYDKIHCARDVANLHSLANQPSFPGPKNPTVMDNTVNYLANAVFGNTISGIVDFFDVAKTATNAAPVYASLVTNGVRLGLPGGGIVSQGLAGTTQDTILKKAFSNLGPSGSVKAAGLAGYLKLGYDVMTFGYGLYECTNF